MVLADTSIWVEHLRKGNSDLSILLRDGNIFCHPFVIGELACENIKNRNKSLNYLQHLPSCTNVSNEEVLTFLEKRKLMGKGLGLIDAHLLSSALISKTLIWTLDKPLREIATSLKISFRP